MSETNKKYTCLEYRTEMILLGLNKQLSNPELSDDQRNVILQEIVDLEKAMGMD